MLQDLTTKIIVTSKNIIIASHNLHNTNSIFKILITNIYQNQFNIKLKIK